MNEKNDKTNYYPCDKKRFFKVADEIRKEMMNWPPLDEYVDITSMEYDYDAIVPHVTKNYYSEQVSGEGDRFGLEAYMGRLKKARIACPSCAIGCHDCDKLGGKYNDLITCQSHLWWYPGFQLDLPTFEDSVYCAHLCQIYGIDMWGITLGAQSLSELHKQGLITAGELEGLEVSNIQSMSNLIEKVAFRQGIGDTLADGVLGIINRFGKKTEKVTN